MCGSVTVRPTNGIVATTVSYIWQCGNVAVWPTNGIVANWVSYVW